MTSSAPAEAVALKLTPPKEWAEKPARPMTEQVLAAPKAAGDAEDADVAVSTLGNVDVPLQMNVERWCTQFELPAGQGCAQAAKQEPLPGTRYPTTLVEISGAFIGGAMFAAPGPPKPGYKMLAAEVRMTDRLWFVKMVGPAKTVDHWRDAFVNMVKQAK